MTPALLIVIMLSANSGQDLQAKIPMDSLRDCKVVANFLMAPGLFPKIKFAGCAIKKAQSEESKVDYSVEQGV